MRIEQNNQYFNQYAGFGTKSKKDAIQTFSVDSDEKPGEKVNDKIKSDMLSKFTRVDNSRMLHVGLGAKIQATDNGLSVKNDEVADTEITDEDLKVKREVMNGIMTRLGIKGQLTGQSIQTVPQNFSTYYIETEGAEKNIFVVELENGEFIFTETDQDHSDILVSFSKDSVYLGTNEGKLNVEQLKRAFAKFFNVAELKDFVLEYWETKEKSESMSMSITS